MYNKNEPETIQALFNSIATHYDRTNAILSFQMHKWWNSTLIKTVIQPQRPKILLDVCCGTGAIAFEYLKSVSSSINAYMLDFSEGMLQYAKHQSESLKLDQHHITFLHADAQAIPLPDNSVDCATIAYGIRNVHSPQKCMQEIFRVLRPKAVFGILELTMPSNSLLRLGHQLYLRTALPLLGKLCTANQQAYEYLWNSIKTFASPEELKKMMHAEGFQQIQQRPLLGGIATILSGTKL